MAILAICARHSLGNIKDASGGVNASQISMIIPSNPGSIL